MAQPTYVGALIFCMVALLFKAAAASRVADLDMFHQMALFREALRIGGIPRDDVFSYMPTLDPVVHHEWGTGAVLYAVAVASGWGSAGIILLHTLLIALLAVVCCACATSRGASKAALIFIAPLAVLMLAPGLAPVRAQMFTFLFLACLLLFLQADRQGARWWIAPWLAIYVSWLNIHGGVVVGLVVFALYSLESLIRDLIDHGSIRLAMGRSRHRLSIGVAMLLLLGANPYGWDLVPYLIGAISLYRPMVAEWAPLWDPRVDRRLAVIYACAVFFVAYAVLRSGGVRKLHGLPIVVVTAFGALQHQRLLPVFAVVWFCYVPAFLVDTPVTLVLRAVWLKYRGRIAAVAVVWGVSNLFAGISEEPWRLRLPSQPGEATLVYPAGAVEYMREQRFVGNLMTPFDVGAFVSWKLYPTVKVSMDSRYEAAYPPGSIEQNQQFYAAAADWPIILASHPTDAILVPSWSPVAAELAGRGSYPSVAWNRVYSDDAYSLFVRTGSVYEYDLGVLHARQAPRLPASEIF